MCWMRSPQSTVHLIFLIPMEGNAGLTLVENMAHIVTAQSIAPSLKYCRIVYPYIFFYHYIFAVASY